MYNMKRALKENDHGLNDDEYTKYYLCNYCLKKRPLLPFAILIGWRWRTSYSGFVCPRDDIPSFRFTKLKVLYAIKTGKANKRFRSNYTPLMHASSDGELDMVRTLLKLGAEVNARNNYGDTALMKAAQYGHEEIVRSLMGSGAKTKLKYIFDSTPLSLASDIHDSNVMRLMYTKNVYIR